MSPEEIEEKSLTLSNGSRKSRWAIVLAGGDGLRMEPFISEFIGDRTPKQFCTFLGTRSILQHTLDRTAAIVPPQQIITVIKRGQRKYFDAAMASEVPGEVIEQPLDRGTATAIYLALTRIIKRDPLATVLIVPASQFVFPEERMVSYATDACLVAQRHPSDLILIGAYPEGPETDAGWIQPNKREWTRFYGTPGPMAMQALGFRENPTAAEAGLLYRWGWLLNTMVMAARAQTLWDIGWDLLPEMMRRFETFHSVVRAIEERHVDRSHIDIALAHIYRSLDTRDFASGVLQQVALHTRVLPVTDLFWSSWSSPQSIKDTFIRLGMRCPFPLMQYIEKHQVRVPSASVEDLAKNAATATRGQSRVL